MARLRIEFISLDQSYDRGGAGYPNTIRKTYGAISLEVTGVVTTVPNRPVAPTFDYVDRNFVRLIADADMVVNVGGVATSANGVYVGPNSNDIVLPIKKGQTISALTLANL